MESETGTAHVGRNMAEPFGCVSLHFALCVQSFGFHTVLLTISNYLPVRAKGNKFPPIQPAAIILWTLASTDSS